MYNEIILSFVGFIYLFIDEVIMQTGKRECRSLESGQGLVEYALLLVLVATVVILILGIFGESVQKAYCQAALSIAPGVDAPACDKIYVSCNVISMSPFRMSASVSDTAGDDDVTQVVFSVDGIPYNTENVVEYCLQGGDGPCQSYTGASGTHTFSAVATDAEGNTGSCSTTQTLP